MKHLYCTFISVVALLLSASCGKVEKIIEENTEKTYIIISDLHLGDPRSIQDGYGWTQSMKDTLIAFLDYLKTDDSWNELIVAGDLMEEWTTPLNYVTLGKSDGTPITEKEYFKILVETNQDVFNRFRELRNSGRKVVYVPGNHDMQTTSDDFNTYLSGIFDQARTSGVVGMGEYQPDGQIFIEHGHRYDITNAPYIGKVGVDDIPAGSILPPGFFVCKLGTGLLAQDAVTKALSLPENGLDDISYNVMWDVIGVMFGKDSVVTNTDGMTLKYGFEDYAYNTSKLFAGIDGKVRGNEDSWTERCKRIKAYYVPSVTISILSTLVYDFCDQMGIQLLNNADFTPRILVWGHSHAPKLISSIRSGINEKVIYLNTGCWVDGKIAGSDCTGTFGKIIKTKNNNYDVSLCRFDIGSDGKGVTKVLDREELILQQ